MTSGTWITLYLFTSVLVIFPAWEFLQLYRRRNGNASALTASQWIIRRIKAGSKFWLFVAIGFPIFLVFVGIWLSLHWEGWCYWKGWFCEISKNI